MDPSQPPTLQRLRQLAPDLQLALEDLLSARVDLVTRRGLRPELRERSEKEAIPLA
jgi:predicted nucleotidyltransferase